LDGAPFVFGLATLLKQLHPTVLRSAFGFLGQYVRTAVHTVLMARKPVPVPASVVNTLLIMQGVCDALSLPRSLLHCFMPEHVIACITS
jgi:WASH complex subunit strumpellin